MRRAEIDAAAVETEGRRLGNLSRGAGGGTGLGAAEDGRLLHLPGLEAGAQDAGEGADIAGDQEIVLHEAFDGERARVVGVAQAARDGGLHVEGQKIARAARERMQMAAQRPKEVLGLGEAAHFLFRQDAQLRQIVQRLDAVERLGEP